MNERDANRREHYRIWTPCLEAQVTRLRAGRARRFRVRIVDLSGGGALILADQPFGARETLRVHLPAGRDLDRFDATARIIRLSDAGGRWQAALEFMGLSETERDLIVRRVFHEELRRARRRGRR